MGSVHQAYCKCGFNKEISVGGSRRTFLDDSSFPYYCEDCGIVSVNVAKILYHNELAICPICGRSDIAQYGKHPVSIEMDSIIQSDTTIQNRTALNWRSFYSKAYGNLCPNCMDMTLYFEPMPSLTFS